MQKLEPIENTENTQWLDKTYIDVDELNRPMFFKTWDKIVNVANHVGATIGRRLNPESKDIAKSSNTSDMSMYS